MENWKIMGSIMFSWADTSSWLHKFFYLFSFSCSYNKQEERGSVNSRCYSVCWPATIRQALQTSIKDIRARSSTPAGTDVDAEVLSYISACQTYIGDDGLAFWNSTSADPPLSPLVQDLLTAPASQASVERVFTVCGDLTAGKRNRLYKKLARPS